MYGQFAAYAAPRRHSPPAREWDGLSNISLYCAMHVRPGQRGILWRWPAQTTSSISRCSQKDITLLRSFDRRALGLVPRHPRGRLTMAFTRLSVAIERIQCRICLVSLATASYTEPSTLPHRRRRCCGTAVTRESVSGHQAGRAQPLTGHRWLIHPRLMRKASSQEQTRHAMWRKLESMVKVRGANVQA